MTILLCILAWLLCGFAGAYIAYRWVEKSEYDFNSGTVAYISIFGPITLIGMIFCAVIESINWSTIVFKRKSP